MVLTSTMQFTVCRSKTAMLEDQLNLIAAWELIIRNQDLATHFEAWLTSSKQNSKHVLGRKVCGAALQNCSFYMKRSQGTLHALQMSPRLVQSQPCVFQSSRLPELRVI